MAQHKFKIDKDQTFSAIVKWFNSSERPEHITACEEAAVLMLKERFGADKECTEILDAAELKRVTPSFILIPKNSLKKPAYKKFAQSEDCSPQTFYVELSTGEKKDCDEDTVAKLWQTWVISKGVSRYVKDGFVVFEFGEPLEIDLETIKVWK